MGRTPSWYTRRLYSCTYSAWTTLKFPSANRCCARARRRRWPLCLLHRIPGYRRTKWCQIPDTRTLPCLSKKPLQRIQQKACSSVFRSGTEGIYDVSYRFCCVCCRQQHLTSAFPGAGKWVWTWFCHLSIFQLTVWNLAAQSLSSHLTNLFLFIFYENVLPCNKFQFSSKSWDNVIMCRKRRRKIMRQDLIWWNIKFRVRMNRKL